MIVMDVALVNETKGHRFSDWQETFTDPEDKPSFRDLQQEWGRCTSTIYTDGKDGTKATGWYFEKRLEYEDSRETYLRGAWITFFELPNEPEDD